MLDFERINFDRAAAILGLIQLGKVPFEGTEIAHNRGVKLAIHICHIRHGIPDDFRRVMNVIERSDPSKREWQVSRICGEIIWFLLSLARVLRWKEWRL